MSLPANISNLVTAIEQTQSRVAQQTGNHQFIKLSKTGDWTYGANDTEVEEGSKWAINPNSLATGYACWGDGEMIDEAMSLITDAPIVKTNLPQHEYAWKPQVAFEMACISGEDKGVQVLYSATSVGGQNAYKDVLNAILAQAKTGSDAIVPVCTLGVSSYKHKKYGKINTPIFRIVEWATLEGLAATPAVEADDDDDSEADYAEEPVRRRRRV